MAFSRVRKAVDVLTARKVLRSQYRTVFSGETGKAVLANIARDAGQFDDRIGATEHETYVNLGERRLFLKIVAFLDMTDEQLQALRATGRDDE